VDWRFTDLGVTHRTTLRNGVLTHRVRGDQTNDPRHPATERADLTLTLDKPRLLAMITRAEFEGIDHDGDLGVIGRLLAVLETPVRDFPLVTP
jgi:alkyl sulfatase BDS1-like metallo-beta-lactamase superfamily hydrolase